MFKLEGLPSETEIRSMVDAFYARVRTDPVLGPVFESRVTNWDTHLDRMTAFWGSVLLARPGFKGDPVGKHRGMSELTPAHYDRWLELFDEVVADLFPAELAANIHGRAARMRVVLEGPPAQRL